MNDVDAPTVPAGLTLAPLVRRVLGLLLDQLIIVVPVVIVAVGFGLRVGDEISDDALFWITFAATAVAFVYHTTMVGLLGRTVGKLATGTRVVRADGGEAVGWTAATMRALVPLVFGAVPQVGMVLGFVVYALASFSPLRQGLHDRAAGTLVVLAPTSSPSAPT